jgi:hypothetical protein
MPDHDPYQRRPIGYESSADPAPPTTPPLPSLPARRFVMPFGLVRMVWTFTAVLLGVILVIAPIVEPTFRNNNADLPAGTKLLFSASRFLKATYLWVPIALAGLALPFLIALWASSARSETDRRAGVRVITVALFLLGAGLTVWVVLSLFLPYVSLLQNLTGGK